MRELIIEAMKEFRRNDRSKRHFIFPLAKDYKKMTDERLLEVYKQAVLTYCE